jgi:hypothetical protein
MTRGVVERSYLTQTPKQLDDGFDLVGAFLIFSGLTMAELYVRSWTFSFGSRDFGYGWFL